MTFALSVVLLLVCAYTAKISVPWMARGAGEAATRRIAFLIAFFGCFFATFLVLGLVGFIAGLPLIRTDAAVAVSLLIALIARWFGRRSPDADGHDPLPSGGPAGPRGSRRSLPNLLALAAAGVFSFCGLLLLGGSPIGFEVQAYHLPSAIHILQSRSLTPWDIAFLHTYPLNASIFYAFLLQFLPEHLVAASDLCFLAVFVYAIYAISRQVSSDRDASLLAATGAATIPLVAFSSFELSADVGGIAFLALAIYLTCEASLPAVRRAALVGAAAGLAFGFKSLHIIGGAILLVALLARAQPALSKGERASARLRVLASFAAAWLVFGGFWLWRNWTLFHNPLYPVWMPMFGRLLGWSKAFDLDYPGRAATQFEWVRHSWEWAVYPWVEWHAIGENFKHSSGLGAFFAATIPISFAAAAWSVVREGSLARRRILLTLLAGTIVVVFTWWIFRDRQPRYAMGALAFACPLVAWAIASTEGVNRRLFEGVAAVSAAIMLVAIASNEFIGFGERVVRARGYARHRFYEYPRAIDSLPPGSTILNLGERPSHYQLVGAQLTNRVISLPEATRLLTGKAEVIAPVQIALTHQVLEAKGVTHVFTEGAQLVPDDCVALSEVARLDHNPVNGLPLAKPRVLYATRYCDAKIANGRVSP